jgi:hypothetical protein
VAEPYQQLACGQTGYRMMPKWRNIDDWLKNKGPKRRSGMRQYQH